MYFIEKSQGLHSRWQYSDIWFHWQLWSTGTRSIYKPYISRLAWWMGLRYPHVRSSCLEFSQQDVGSRNRWLWPAIAAVVESRRWVYWQRSCQNSSATSIFYILSLYWHVFKAPNRPAYMTEIGGSTCTTSNTILFSKIDARNYQLLQMLIPKDMLGSAGGLSIVTQCAARTDTEGQAAISAYGSADWYGWTNVKGVPQRY